MASGNIKDPKKLSKRDVLSSSTRKLQQETEQNIRNINALDKQLKIQTLKEVNKLSEKEVKKLAGSFKQDFKEVAKQFGLAAGEAALNLTDAAFSNTQRKVDEFIKGYSQYYANINTMMLGTGKNYNQMLSTLKSAVTGSRATNVLSVLDKLNKLISQGITYNVEQRAFLEELSSKVATTWNATNTTLLQIVRLNRSDSSAAYLGMEAALTEFFNANFSDNSFLAKNINESISASIYEATSQLGPTLGAEFEYVVQKWLGSFYESGVNESTVQSIAQGLGYLGSGNVSSLTSNTALNNLFTAAANNAGLNYSDLLTKGLTPASTSKLLEGIYQQAVVMSRSGDQVARSQFASMFGMTVSDLTAMMRLTSNDLVAIASNMYNYSDMISKTEYELHQVAARTNVKEAIDNTIANIMAEIGDGIATSEVFYLTYQISDMLKGRIPIPIPFSSSLDLGTTMQAAIIGTNILTSMSDIFAALVGSKQLSLNSFSGMENYGGGFVSGTGTGVVSRSSGSATYYGTSDTTSMVSGSVAEMKTTGTEIVADANASSDQSERSFDDLYNKMDEIYNILSATTIGSSAIFIKDADASLQ